MPVPWASCSSTSSNSMRILISKPKLVQSLLLKQQIQAIHILSRGRVSRRKNEMADAVCIRDPFYRGHLGYRHLSHNDKCRYDRHYSERNSAKKVTQQSKHPDNATLISCSDLTIIQETIRMTASQIRGYLHDGKPMTSPVLVGPCQSRSTPLFRRNFSTSRVHPIGFSSTILL